MTDPSQLAPWLFSGNIVFVKDGKKDAQYLATLVSEPYLSDDGLYVIDIKWSDRRDTKTVDCSRCVAPLVDGNEVQTTSAGTRFRSKRRPVMMPRRLQVTRNHGTAESSRDGVEEEQGSVTEAPLANEVTDDIPPRVAEIVRPLLKRAASVSTITTDGTTADDVPTEASSPDGEEEGTVSDDISTGDTPQDEEAQHGATDDKPTTNDPPFPDMEYDVVLEEVSTEDTSKDDGDESNMNKKKVVPSESREAHDDDYDIGGAEVQENEETTESISDPPSWIRKDIEMKVLCGDKPFEARALSDPFRKGSSFVVRVRWLYAAYNENVDCSRCRKCAEPMEDGDGSRKKRHYRVKAKEDVRYKKVKIHPHSRSRRAKNGVVCVEHLDRESNMNGEGRAFAAATSDNTSYSVVSDGPEQLLGGDETSEKELPSVDRRDELKRSLLASLPQTCWSPALIDAALDMVGPPYSQNAVVAYIESMGKSSNVAYWDEPKNFTVEIGMKVRCIFQANRKPMIGTVVEKVDELVLNDSLELVQVWKVDFGGGFRVEMEEEELRWYRYPQPILPPCLGRQFQCLELFGGMWFRNC